MTSRTRIQLVMLFSLTFAILAMSQMEVFALITGGEGNKPIQDPGWPKGGADIINLPARIAYWVGPPFGGGQWHAEYRGDAQSLNVVLANFALLDVKAKQVVLHDGVGNSFWLNMNDEPAKRVQAIMDFRFMVWVPENWHRLQKSPLIQIRPDPNDAKDGPPAQLDVYTGGNIRWADVVVPKALKVVDNRLEAHGCTLEDGVVIEGKILDLKTKKPLLNHMRLEKIEPQKTGGYRYTTVVKQASDDQGKWGLKKVQVGRYQIVVEAEGYAPRLVGHLNADSQPRWHGYDSGLTEAATVTGRIVDDKGKPLPEVEVRLQDITVIDSKIHYRMPNDPVAKTDAEGRFRMEQVPTGNGTIWLHKPGYNRAGLGMPIQMPVDDVELTMKQAGTISVTVDFTGKERPAAYLIHIAPEGGDKVGSWGGSGQINDKNQIIFENVPAARYVLYGSPNPSAANQQTDPITFDVVGGQTAEFNIKAK